MNDMTVICKAIASVAMCIAIGIGSYKSPYSLFALYFVLLIWA